MTETDRSSMPLKTEKISKFVLIIYTLLFSSAHYCNGCTTPDGRNGDCRIINLCQSLLDIIRAKGISSLEALSFMRASTCGYDGENPKVCCSRYNYESTVSTRPNHISRPRSTARPYTLAYTTSKIRPVTKAQSSLIPERWTQKPQTTAAPKLTQYIDKGNSKYSYTSPNFLLPNECGKEQPRNKIIGGDKTDLDEFPWMALIQYKSETEIINGCGGVLINARYVLTAAHCLLSIPSGWKLHRVLLGEYNTRTNPDCFDMGGREQDCADHVMVMNIEQQITHPKYGKPTAFSNDIALLRLDHEVEMTRFVQPICLPQNPNPSEIYWASGWGQTESQSQSDVKLKVKLPYVDYEKCAKLYATKHFYLGDGQMCAGGSFGSDTCKGDSGGPLMRQENTKNGPSTWSVEGLVSIGHTPCGIQGWPGVYTKVHYYVPWIRAHLRP
ncbi:hypothetical protein QAD02_005222 [Eretmocerus hayati]|uniref:Uncharacterized protein n=1 Tax=Eretmocerus hayati TaxID=131215 RepID=A0ACC2NRR6_9HYME|nr:hypothetical protein QAD02_005222 [Eretmocerus hayati]